MPLTKCIFVVFLGAVLSFVSGKDMMQSVMIGAILFSVYDIEEKLK